MANVLSSNIARVSGLVLVALAAGLVLYFVALRQPEAASAQEAVESACAQMATPTDYDVVYTVVGDEQVIFQAEDYDPGDDLETAKVVGNLQVSGEDYHLVLQYEGVDDPAETKYVDGVLYLNDGTGNWIQSGSTPDPVVHKCVDLTSFVDVGKEDVGKTPTTRYSATPVKKDALFEEERHDFWLDENNKLIQHTRRSKYMSTHEEGGVLVYQSELTLELRFVFSDIGVPNVIEAPK